jgi:phage shock protein PspC (stress-responsive transcriptional regulator)
MPTQLPPGESRPKTKTWAIRGVWFVALWLVGLGAVSALAYILRWWIAPHA